MGSADISIIRIFQILFDMIVFDSMIFEYASPFSTTRNIKQNIYKIYDLQVYNKNEQV